ncbi:carbohydrate ABC transporter permease [Actinomadura sp. DC4]|uniref:carbohydrate ABC transporter permease n=1 Tax=Actinomadura sp. DC4 TaxID=3055069 RepID=UPI0025B01860|nr:carbohydrate ABC transporter permease [Actinomadura sp. DC4]MDN3360135.1 carbohydrate ABC transporter permease [Actinomadura sp. DC4]
MSQWLVLTACVLLLVYFAFPVYVIVSTALKGPGATGGSLGLPRSIDMSGFRLAWEQLKGNFWNSLQIAVPGTVISCMLGALNGFVLAKSPFRGAKLLFVLMMVGMFVPFQAVIIPLFIVLKALGLQGTLVGITAVHVIYGLPFVTLIMRNYYVTVPDAIVEAATIDGCGLVRTFFRVMLPLSIPGFVVAGIFQFTNIWNDFLFGLIVTSQQTWPITVRLNNLLGDTSVDYGTLMAGALIVAAPTVLVYIGLGRYFIGGLTSGAVK